ncbi:MAG: hypothetical protein KKG42_11250 [Gammaproteobacteria bacterium]|nr:hypothetical protein [Gammaproteobacteria bacterium]
MQNHQTLSSSRFDPGLAVAAFFFSVAAQKFARQVQPNKALKSLISFAGTGEAGPLA